MKFKVFILLCFVFFNSCSSFKEKNLKTIDFIGVNIAPDKQANSSQPIKPENYSRPFIVFCSLVAFVGLINLLTSASPKVLKRFQNQL